MLGYPSPVLLSNGESHFEEATWSYIWLFQKSLSDLQAYETHGTVVPQLTHTILVTLKLSIVHYYITVATVATHVASEHPLTFRN
jgi:hypothetical protein